MALFKFRKGREEQPASVAPAQTVEAVRRRAMHRLIGAAVLVLAGVIGFPLIFDNQPRPIPVDLPIDIVDRNKVKPLVMPPAAANPAAANPAATNPVGTNPAAAPAVAAAPAPSAKPAAVQAPPALAAKQPDPEPSTAAVAAPAAPVVAAPVNVKPPANAAEVAAAKALDAQKARALLEGRPVNSSKTAAAATVSPPPAASDKPAAAPDDRFVVQVGAFADPAKAREVRQKVESAGLKTYTQVVKTSDGERTRVRVGPFTDKEQATQAADKIRKLNLSVAILTL